MMLDTQNVGYRHPSAVQHSKITRYCACVEYQLLLHSKNQAKCLAHEPHRLVMAALELSFLVYFLLTLFFMDLQKQCFPIPHHLDIII